MECPGGVLSSEDEAPSSGDERNAEPGDVSATGAQPADVHYNSFGFAEPRETSDAAIFAAAQKYAQSFVRKGQRRLQRFETRRAKLAGPGELHWASVPRKQLKKLLRKGIPATYRKEVWWSILGCGAAKAKSLKTFKELCSVSLDKRVSDDIERDLMRSFPSHKKFKVASASSEEESGSGLEQLRAVLHAFAVQWPRVGYCQGLNFIAGLLLIVFDDAERAFWALSCAMEHLGIDGYYLEGMAVLRRDMLVLEELLKQKCAVVARLLDEAGVQLISICSEWFLTWFAKSLPYATTLRVWDTLFLEGWKVFFRVSVAIFKRAEAEIVKCNGDFEAIMKRGKRWANQQVEHNELLKLAFHLEPMRRADLEALRASCMEKIKQEDAARLRITAKPAG